MARGPESARPTSRDLGLRGARARAFTALKNQYGAWWVRASNGEAYARLADNPYGGKFQTGEYSFNWRHISDSIDNKIKGKLIGQ